MGRDIEMTDYILIKRGCGKKDHKLIKSAK